MHNISTIYRFNTPFLNSQNERDGILTVIKKIEKSIEFDWIIFEKSSNNEWNYKKISLNFSNNLWRIDFFYILSISNTIYHLPIFKLNIFLNKSFLLSNESKEKAVKFLNNIFECFDWLNEKEYLIDLDNNFYYKNWFFSSKKYPSYDFSNLEEIKSDFESKNWMQLLKNFITKFQNKEYILTKKNADEYHKLHGILLYFIYLVFIISQTIEKTDKTLDNIKNIKWEWIYEWNLELMKNRLNYVDELNKDTFERYKRRLELFFKMF